MVDTVQKTVTASAANGAGHAVICDVHRGREKALALVDATSPSALHSSYQSPVFLRSWIEHSPHEPVFLSFRAASGHVILPLEQLGRRLAYPGVRHANGNFPIGGADGIRAIGAAGTASIVKAIRGCALDVDAIVLERQLPALAGTKNPFVFAQSVASPNPALALSLEGGFDEVLKRHSAKRRRKRFRTQEKRLTELGGYEFVGHVGREAVSETLATFFAMKAKSFLHAGITDVFAEAHVRAFFTRLFEIGSDSNPPSHTLKVLMNAGRPIAIIGCSIREGRVIVEFGTYDAEMAEIGPGDMLFFLAIREAAESGLNYFDFGIGDEFYKRGWCEIETTQMDTIIALSGRGRMISAGKSARNAVVRTIKGNDTVWKIVKQLRRHIPSSR